MTPFSSPVPLRLVAGACALLILALLVHDRNRWKSIAALRSQQVLAEKAAHSATVANYRAAAERARREDAQNLARAKAQQAAINERTLDEYETRIGAARAYAERLRRESGSPEAPPRGGRAAPVPGLPTAAEGIGPAPGKDGLSYTDRLIATEQAIQLDALIEWVRRQSRVSAGGPSRPDASREQP